MPLTPTPAERYLRWHLPDAQARQPRRQALQAHVNVLIAACIRVGGIARRIARRRLTAARCSTPPGARAVRSGFRGRSTGRSRSALTLPVASLPLLDALGLARSQVWERARPSVAATSPCVEEAARWPHARLNTVASTGRFVHPVAACPHTTTSTAVHGYILAVTGCTSSRSLSRTTHFTCCYNTVRCVFTGVGASCSSTAPATRGSVAHIATATAAASSWIGAA